MLSLAMRVCVCLVCVCAASLFPCSFSASAEQKAASSSCSRWIHKTMPSEANGLMTLRFWISLLPPPSHTHTYSYTSTKSTRRGDSPKQKGHKFELVFFCIFRGLFRARLRSDSRTAKVALGCHGLGSGLLGGVNKVVMMTFLRETNKLCHCLL